MENQAHKNVKIKLTPEEMFSVFLECNVTGAPVKEILARHHLKPWHLLEIRKKVKEASLAALSTQGKRKGKKQYVTADQFQSVCRELEQTKDALSAVGHELALLKKRVS